ncbi:putative tRNA-splicing endonuclease [Candidatus Nitrososphaera gargensis Ga9.2]|uniref:Putative tRNA-splicing endonuclease n=1 Tax=Nitrososphaera gargensis (strain Ga9.2) TaxID=1237085 RepID=K0IKB3_NITGG|nr:tRNA-intron lyase [Candidatus Nitrososphaera gargensis]AFU58792.1 putative tRNA-splicing endonuclease [Candidatus Nitrososphaera gargensis Ga9.2]
MSSSATAPPSAQQPFSGSKMSEAEMPSVVEARLAAGGKILVDKTRFQDELRTKGFGEKEDAEYVLKPYEALYLMHTKRLALKNKPGMTFDPLFELLLKYDRNIMTKFLVYRDLRSRGYVAKEGFGFGNDFRVYDRGEYEKKPAKYVIFGINEGTNTTVKDFASAIDQIERMGKEAVVAVIERRGEVIYYKASKMRFTENRYRR